MMQCTDKISNDLDSPAKAQIESFLRAVAQAPQSLLMLDFDGTLAPFHKDRTKAFPYPGIASVLQEIISGGKTRVVIVSGRDATEIIPLLGIEPHPEIWGLHGLQHVKVDGSIEVSRVDESTLEALAAAQEWLLSQRLQHTAEYKPGSIAVHWRGLDESEVESIRWRVMLGWTAIANDSGLALLEFDGGIEIRTRSVDKGTAVRTILSEVNAEVPAIYLGDDVTDEEAFRALNGRGLTILVRPAWRSTAAQMWLKPPDEVLDLLTGYLQASRQRNNSTYKTGRW